MKAAPFPWAAAMRFGLGQLRLSPTAFWAMTPRELAAMLPASISGTERPDAAVLARLMQLYPDEKSHG